MQRIFTIPFHVPGTLSANLTSCFKLPFDCQLVHVSAVGSNANDGLLTVGNTTTADAYCASFSIGDSNVPAVRNRADFVGGQYPHIAAGTVIAWALDFDGASGTATQNFTLLLTFTEG